MIRDFLRSSGGKHNQRLILIFDQLTKRKGCVGGWVGVGGRGFRTRTADVGG